MKEIERFEKWTKNYLDPTQSLYPFRSFIPLILGCDSTSFLLASL